MDGRERKREKIEGRIGKERRREGEKKNMWINANPLR